MKSDAARTNERHDDWNFTNGEGYILNRDRSHAAAGRLNLQFYLWKDALGYNIHPHIASTLSANAAIADVAAGSGIWLIDVSRQYPHAQLQGLDFNIDQAPHPKLLPGNVSMSYIDLRDEVPAELVGKFDYIHTRLLVLVVENQDPKPILRNLLKLLKPGGWLQWDELDAMHATVTKADPELSTPALDGLREWSSAGGRHDWAAHLGDFMSQEGFVDCETDFIGDPIALSRAFNDQHLLTAEEFAEGLAKLGKTETAARYFQLIEEAYKESAQGAALCVPRVVCVARKRVDG